MAVDDGAGLDAGRVPWRYGDSRRFLHEFRPTSAGGVCLCDGCIDRTALLVIVAVDGA